MSSPIPADGSSEKARLDRNWIELLQELRVAQTGVQLIAGFLLTLPFQSRFDGLDEVQVAIYLWLVLHATVTIGLTLTPVAIHRHLFGRRIKDRLVQSAHRFMQLVLVAIGVLMAGIVLLVFDVVVGRTPAIVAASCLLALMAVLLLLVPRLVSRSGAAG